MTKQQTVTLNLTKQEAECLVAVFEIYANNYYLNLKETKPCRPFIDKLKNKLSNSVKK